MAPAGVARDVVTRLNGELVKILETPDMRDKRASLGTDDPVADSPGHMAAYIRGELPKWDKIIEASGSRRIKS